VASKKKPRKLSPMEREIILSSGGPNQRATTLKMADDEVEWHVFSESPRWIAYLTRLFGPPLRSVGSHGGVEWEIPKGELAIRKRKKRVLTDEQKQVARDRLMRLREAK